MDTGERPTLFVNFEDVNPTLQFAYRLAVKKIKKNSNILDYGCGGGYGTEYLSRFTKGETTGFDIDKKTIKLNQQFYRTNKRIIMTSNENSLTKYDLIVSFQVIEHIKKGEIPTYLNRLKMMLNPGGVIFIATVNKYISSYKLKKPAFPFHEYEYRPYELAKLLQKYFNKVKTYGQIEKNTQKRVKRGQWSYKDYENCHLELKVIRIISQWEIVRFFARILPQSFKNLFFPRTKKDSDFHHEYNLTTNKKEVENSYIFICECK